MIGLRTALACWSGGRSPLSPHLICGHHACEDGSRFARGQPVVGFTPTGTIASERTSPAQTKENGNLAVRVTCALWRLLARAPRMAAGVQVVDGGAV